MEIAALFWFYKEFDICKSRLQEFKKCNPNAKIYALYGGPLEHSEKAKLTINSYIDDFYCYPENKSPRWKWQNGDQMILHWYANRGLHLQWDSIFILQWDMIVSDSLSNMFPGYSPNDIIFSGARPISEIEEWWPWTNGEHEKEYDKFVKFHQNTLQSNSGIYGCLFIVVCLPKRFFEKMISLGEHNKLGFLEYSWPTLANHFGFDFYENHHTKVWWAKDPTTLNVPWVDRALNAVATELPLGLICKELNNPKGRRIFHPFFNLFPQFNSFKYIFSRLSIFNDDMRSHIRAIRDKSI